MALNDGTKLNYGTIKVTQNKSKLIYYNGKGLRKMFNPDMIDDKKEKAEELKKLDEKALMKLGYVAEILLSNIKELN